MFAQNSFHSAKHITALLDMATTSTFVMKPCHVLLYTQLDGSFSIHSQEYELQSFNPWIEIWLYEGHFHYYTLLNMAHS